MYGSAPAATAPIVPMVGFNIFAVAVKEAAPIEVWPEHHAVFGLFCKMQTQWRVGMAGPTGLDYAALLALMARLKLSDDDHDQLFDDIQTLELAALTAMTAKD